MSSRFSIAELRYLSSQRLGRLATVARDGTPQNKPVGFHFNAELGTIDIYGFKLASSQKYRNIRANPNVALVIDDAIGGGAPATRFMEIRGRAEAIPGQAPPTTPLGAEIIRIQPSRIVSWNIDSEQPGLQARDLRSPVMRSRRHSITPKLPPGVPAREFIPPQ